MTLKQKRVLEGKVRRRLDNILQGPWASGPAFEHRSPRGLYIPPPLLCPWWYQTWETLLSPVSHPWVWLGHFLWDYALLYVPALWQTEDARSALSAHPPAPHRQYEPSKSDERLPRQRGSSVRAQRLKPEADLQWVTVPLSRCFCPCLSFRRYSLASLAQHCPQTYQTGAGAKKGHLWKQCIP